jgi:hypothetical protein
MDLMDVVDFTGTEVVRVRVLVFDFADYFKRVN